MDKTEDYFKAHANREGERLREKERIRLKEREERRRQKEREASHSMQQQGKERQAEKAQLTQTGLMDQTEDYFKEFADKEGERLREKERIRLKEREERRRQKEREGSHSLAEWLIATAEKERQTEKIQLTQTGIMDQTEDYFKEHADREGERLREKERSRLKEREEARMRAKEEERERLREKERERQEMQRREEQRRREKEGDAKEKKREAEQMVDQTESTPATSSYANLATDSRGHCSWFLTRTNKEHQATMEHPFMKSIYSKAFDIRAYVAHLSCQFLIFSKLEEYCSFSRAEMPLCAVYDEALHRSLALSADLCFWAGEAYERTLSYSRSLSYDLGEHSFMVPSKATVKYLERLHADRSDPWLLLCHHFLNYNAVLSGGQFLASMVSARGHLWGAEPPQGVAFYAFPPDCVPTHGRVQQYIDTIDGLSIPEQQRSCMLKCMQTIYSLLLEMMDECHAIAPVLAETTDVGGSGLEKVSEVSLPPPPLAAAERQMTFSELLKHDATSGGGTNLGMPLATSVLGRIYDVTGAKDLFGAKGPYEMFTGHDGTYNLAVMSLKQKTLDKFQYEFDDEEKQCLADWIAYFDHRYGPPIAQLTDKSHSISLSDLPRAERIPFQAQPEAGRKDSPPPASRL